MSIEINTAAKGVNWESILSSSFPVQKASLQQRARSASECEA